MSTLPDGVYLPTADPCIYEPTELANAGWYDEGQHGGALAALVGGHVDRIPTLVPMQATRFTMELFRVARLVPLCIETSVIREGKKIQVLECRVLGEGVELARARIQRLRVDDIGLPGDVAERGPDLPGPESVPPAAMTWGHGPDDKVMFHRSAIDAREVSGGFHQPGPGAIWIRSIVPVIAGREITPLQRMLVAADFCNGISSPTAEPDWLFMNPDLSVNINRVPDGEWVALDAESAYSPMGRGIATGTLWDSGHFLGRSTQTLFLDRPIGG